MAAFLLALTLVAGCSDAGQSGASDTTQADPERAATISTTTTTATPTPARPERDLSRYESRLQQALDEDIAADPSLVAELLLVQSGNARWSGSAGVADPATRAPSRPDMTLRIASVTKTFVAAATWRLIEEDRFTPTAPISGLLPAELVSLLRAGGYNPDTITVAQLLSHNSSVLDFTFGPGRDYVGRILADPTRSWTREEQIAFAMDGDPVGAPGELYHYSDTGYGLLGAIIEVATGRPLGLAVRDLLDFDRLGLEHTYWEVAESAAPGSPDRLHQFFGDRDTYGWSPTIDLFGGGGLVSSLGDQAAFFRSLLAGEVFNDPATLAAMMDVPPTNTDVRVPGDPTPYAAASGLFRSTIDGVECWGHDGFWGVAVRSCPSIDVTIVRSISQATPGPSYDRSRVGAILAEIIRAATI